MTALRDGLITSGALAGRLRVGLKVPRPGRRALFLAVFIFVAASSFFVFAPAGQMLAREVYALHYGLDALPGFGSVHHGVHGALESREPQSGTSPEAFRQLLVRTGYGPGRESVTALYGTDQYFDLTGQAQSAAQYRPDSNIVFLVWEDIHSGDLPEPLAPLMRVDGGREYAPKLTTTSANAVHHRASIVVYPGQDDQGRTILPDGARSLELVLPPVNEDGERSVLSWTLPVAIPEGTQPVRFQFTLTSVMALLGGLLASMWPCLFQLTAYFIPTLAGLSMAQAEGRESASSVRTRVLKTAIVFVAGIVVVYTLAGAAAGFAAQSLGGTSFFETWRRPFSIVAGLVILFMAVRVAVNARAPFVCKMPMFAGLRSRKNGYLGTMVLGVAFATGCTTCFGAAIVIAMLTYVGTTGTALYGALIMFIFALGIAIPLVIGALAMARVLQLLGRLEKVAPWMALASSAIMAGFAVLLLTDRFMWLGNLVGSDPYS